MIIPIENIEKAVQRREEILSDDRVFYPAATVFENPPLALIQVMLTTELMTIETILGLSITNVNKIRSERNGK